MAEFCHLDNVTFTRNGIEYKDGHVFLNISTIRKINCNKELNICFINDNEFMIKDEPDCKKLLEIMKKHA